MPTMLFKQVDVTTSWKMALRQWLLRTVVKQTSEGRWD